ncbi:MAG: hypothetical protein FI725_07570 [SAR202 cluster bacterium]|nr:hypothetical protein [SAR202 cluster bacterium]|tara:strand:+ start:382 stop:636 length:255 start_codon:yes stop_codon:yes gene_type:complete
MAMPFTDAAQDAVGRTIEEYPDVILKWKKNERGSWGFLAGRAVIMCKQNLQRSLSDRERRDVWQLLWFSLNDEIMNTRNNVSDK